MFLIISIGHQHCEKLICWALKCVFYFSNTDPTVCNKFNKFKIEKRQSLENYIYLINSIKINFKIYFCLPKTVDFHLSNIEPTVCNKFNKFKIVKRQTLENYIYLMNTSKIKFNIFVFF